MAAPVDDVTRPLIVPVVGAGGGGGEGEEGCCRDQRAHFLPSRRWRWPRAQREERRVNSEMPAKVFSESTAVMTLASKSEMVRERDWPPAPPPAPPGPPRPPATHSREWYVLLQFFDRREAA